MKKSLVVSALLIVNIAISQTLRDSTQIDIQVNSAQKMLNKTDTKLTIGGYGEITYNQPESENGELDVQRFVLMVGINLVMKFSLFQKLK